MGVGGADRESQKRVEKRRAERTQREQGEWGALRPGSRVGNEITVVQSAVSAHPGTSFVSPVPRGPAKSRSACAPRVFVPRDKRRFEGGCCAFLG